MAVAGLPGGSFFVQKVRDTVETEVLELGNERRGRCKDAVPGRGDFG